MGRYAHRSAGRSVDRPVCLSVDPSVSLSAHQADDRSIGWFGRFLGLYQPQRYSSWFVVLTCSYSVFGLHEGLHEDLFWYFAILTLVCPFYTPGIHVLCLHMFCTCFHNWRIPLSRAYAIGGMYRTYVPGTCVVLLPFNNRVRVISSHYSVVFVRRRFVDCVFLYYFRCFCFFAI